MSRRDEQAALYHAHHAEVTRALTATLRDPDLGREAADEAFVRAVQHWRKVSRVDNPGGWLYRVGLNWARSRWRKRRREVVTDEPPDRGQPGVELPDDELLHALEHLPMKYRSALVLRYLREWEYPEIADALGVAQGTVRSRVSRGLTMLEQRMDGEAR